MPLLNDEQKRELDAAMILDYLAADPVATQYRLNFTHSHECLSKMLTHKTEIASAIKGSKKRLKDRGIDRDRTTSVDEALRRALTPPQENA